jgi:hypothetical protein
VSPREEIPQDTALGLQLAAIAGREPPTSFFEIRPLVPPTMAPSDERIWVPIGEVEHVIALIEDQAPRLHVYIGAAPRAVEGGGGVEHVEHVWSLWCDCDSPQAVDKLAEFRPRPSIVICTGSPDHLHAWWPLREPLSPAWAKQANQRLALALGADRNATDAARILRPAGSLNHKRCPPDPVTCIHLDTEMFTVGDVVGGLADDPAYLPKQHADRERTVAGEPSRMIAGLARLVASKPEGERNHGLYWAARRVAEKDGEEGFDTSLALGELRVAAAGAGLPESEIERTIASGLRAGRTTAA